MMSVLRMADVVIVSLDIANDSPQVTSDSYISENRKMIQLQQYNMWDDLYNLLSGKFHTFVITVLKTLYWSL